MRVQLVSDLHMEFLQYIPSIANNNADVLVLSGDICLAEHLYRNPPEVYSQTQVNQTGSWSGWYAERYRQFFRTVSKQFPAVVYVMGNHEHYNGTFNRTENVLRRMLSEFNNIHLLERQSVELNGVVFHGATFWTDMDRSNPLTMLLCKDLMNDYKTIKFNSGTKYRKLRPEDTVSVHKLTVSWLEQALTADSTKPTVVVGHHCPSFSSVDAKYRNHTQLNCAYCTDLSSLIVNNPQIRLWTHGHVHNNNDYLVGDTRIVSNPMGYHNENANFNASLVIEI